MIIDGVNYSWTQPICDTCFAGIFKDHPDPMRIKDEYRDDEQCCVCGVTHRSGLYVRINPATVDHPQSDE